MSIVTTVPTEIWTHIIDLTVYSLLQNYYEEPKRNLGAMYNKQTIRQRFRDEVTPLRLVCTGWNECVRSAARLHSLDGDPSCFVCCSIRGRLGDLIQSCWSHFQIISSDNLNFITTVSIFGAPPSNTTLDTYKAYCYYYTVLAALPSLQYLTIHIYTPYNEDDDDEEAMKRLSEEYKERPRLVLAKVVALCVSGDLSGLLLMTPLHFPSLRKLDMVMSDDRDTYHELVGHFLERNGAEITSLFIRSYAPIVPIPLQLSAACPKLALLTIDPTSFKPWVSIVLIPRRLRCIDIRGHISPEVWSCDFTKFVRNQLTGSSKPRIQSFVHHFTWEELFRHLKDTLDEETEVIWRKAILENVGLFAKAEVRLEDCMGMLLGDVELLRELKK